MDAHWVMFLRYFGASVICCMYVSINIIIIVCEFKRKTLFYLIYQKCFIQSVIAFASCPEVTVSIPICTIHLSFAREEILRFLVTGTLKRSIHCLIIRIKFKQFQKSDRRLLHTKYCFLNSFFFWRRVLFFIYLLLSVAIIS